MGGLSLRGVSGGERKRLAIAAGVLAEPSIIFLDEPSSGKEGCVNGVYTAVCVRKCEHR